MDRPIRTLLKICAELDQPPEESALLFLVMLSALGTHIDKMERDDG